ncbi:MAG: type IV secretion system DNA-binding domain-containing protein [Planctomycetota bacterium]
MIWKAVLLILVSLLCFEFRAGKQRRRKHKFNRGRKLRAKQSKPSKPRVKAGLRWGNQLLQESSATQHFLAVGTTGSGKSIVQRLLMMDVLTSIQPGNDKRVLIFDAKYDASAFMDRINATCRVFSLNPFESGEGRAEPVAWDIAADITSAARALNLAAALIPAEKGGNNQYFTDAARQVLSAVVESLIRHSPRAWTFSHFVHLTLSMERVKATLNQDEVGRETLDNFFGDERTAYQVFTTVVSRMSYYRPVAELWRGRTHKLSLRKWLSSESVLLLGTNATVETALSAINEIMFRVLVEEVDIQTDSTTRRTWFWIDEARLSGPLLRNQMLPYLAVKGRSKGACLLLAFQDIDGFREAAGTRIASEIIAQCSHKALLRMESDESARWASRVIGQHETIEFMQSKQDGLFGKGSQNEHASKRDTVLPSEFYLIPATNPKNGLTGYFISPEVGAERSHIHPSEIEPVIVRSPANVPRRTVLLSTQNSVSVVDASVVSLSDSASLNQSMDLHQEKRIGREAR